MRDARRSDGSTYIPLAIAGLPGTDEEQRYVRQATMMLRYRLWVGPVAAAGDPPLSE